MGISSSSFDLKDAIFNGKDGNIKGASSEIKDQNIALRSIILLFVQSIGNGSCSRFIDDPQNVKTSNDSSILSGFSLRIVEISRNSDNSILNSFAKIGFSSFLHLCQDHGRNFFRS